MTKTAEKIEAHCQIAPPATSVEQNTMKQPTKQTTCDWCGKQRRDVEPFGEETGACFLCRREAARRRIFDETLNRYVRLTETL